MHAHCMNLLIDEYILLPIQFYSLNTRILPSLLVLSLLCDDNMDHFLKKSGSIGYQIFVYPSLQKKSARHGFQNFIVIPYDLLVLY